MRNKSDKKNRCKINCADRKALERRRYKAIGMYKKGLSQYRIAKKLGVSFEAVSKWVDIYKEKGLKGLKTKGKPGPKAQMSEKDLKKLRRCILNGPKKMGYDTDVWTLSRISRAIKDISRVSIKTTQTWRVVISLGFSCQKPRVRAKERNETSIKEWRIQKFPGLKKMGGKTWVYSGLSR